MLKNIDIKKHQQGSIQTITIIYVIKHNAGGIVTPLKNTSCYMYDNIGMLMLAAFIHPAKQHIM